MFMYMSVKYKDSIDLTFLRINYSYYVINVDKYFF